MSRARSVARHHLPRLISEQRHRCCYCLCEVTMSKSKRNHNSYATIDHVVTVSHSKRIKVPYNTYQNMVVACKLCNNLRGCIDAYVFHDLQLWKPENANMRRQMQQLAAFKSTGLVTHLKKVNFCGCYLRQNVI